MPSGAAHESPPLAEHGGHALEIGVFAPAEGCLDDADPGMGGRRRAQTRALRHRGALLHAVGNLTR